MSHIHQKHRKPLLPLYGNNNGDVSESERAHRDRALDEALMESFPASDPVAVSFGYVVNRAMPDSQPRSER